MQKNKEAMSLKLSYKEQQALKTLPHQIEALEEEIKTIKKCLENPDCYQKIGLTKLSEDLQSKEDALEPLIEAWLELEEKIETMQKG